MRVSLRRGVADEWNTGSGMETMTKWGLRSLLRRLVPGLHARIPPTAHVPEFSVSGLTREDQEVGMLAAPSPPDQPGVYQYLHDPAGAGRAYVARTAAPHGPARVDAAKVAIREPVRDLHLAHARAFALGPRGIKPRWPKLSPSLG